MKANEESSQTALEVPTQQEEEAPPLGSIEFINDLTGDNRRRSREPTNQRSFTKGSIFTAVTC
jgi:hypothetical protein